jgi:phage gp36-like protein
MTYCTLADLALAIPAATLIQLSNDDAEATVIDEGVVAEAIRQAEELVDGYLRGRYALPLATVPSIVKDMTVQLARHWLYARRPEGAAPDAVIRGYKTAVQVLEAIRDNKITLGVESGAAAPEPGEMRVRARKGVFTDSFLEKF